ncbi:MAG: iron-sulfur cluster assembly protein [Candidatus Tokpelaia sp. JSC085]|nr:MAG: iron-sulfur cluster assembly protein [Candidatus Tokpelaia sp. JSC085]
MTLTVSDSAAKRISAILASKPGQYALRISVKGGGCSGFFYQYSLVGTQNDDDFVLEKDGARILIDSVSFPFMDGAEVNFVDNLVGQAFKVSNPNAVSSCGCGDSFSMNIF